MEILSLISNNGFIVLNKGLIKILGINATIMLGELASEYEYWKEREELENDYFYSTIENVENNTSLTKYQQSQAINKLLELNLIEVKIRGIPAKRYIKINEQQVVKILDNKKSKNLTTRSKKTEQLEVKKLDGNNNKEIIIKNKNKKDIVKHQHGEYKNVLLTDEEYEKLKRDYSNYNDLITYLDEYIEMKRIQSKKSLLMY